MLCIAKGFQKAPDVCNNPACDILPLLSLFFFLYPLPLLLVVFLLLPLLPLSLAPDLRSHSPANTHPWSPHTNTDSHFLDHVKVTTCTASSTRWAHERDITTTTDNHTNTGINKPGFQLPCSSVFCFSKALTAWISSLPDGQDLLAEVMKRIDFNGRPDDFFRLETACALCAWCWDGLEVALRIETKLVWLLHNHRFYSNEQTAVFLATVSSVRVCQHWGCAWLLSS